MTDNSDVDTAGAMIAKSFGQTPPHIAHLLWAKSSRSAGGSGCCVEATFNLHRVLIRDSKARRTQGYNPDFETILAVSPWDWDEFLAAVTDNELPDTGALQTALIDPSRSVRLVLRVTGETLEFLASEWQAFVAGVRDGELTARELQLIAR